MIKRGYYDEITWTDDPTIFPKVTALINEVRNNVDEHGGWDFGADVDHVGRGTALNWDLYGFGNDVHTGQFLAVIQVRHYYKRSRRAWPNVRKSYFLIGKNEDGTAFAHPVSAQAVHYAIRNCLDVVKHVQDWIFGGDYAAMKRQGDLALIPLKRAPKGEKVETEAMILENSHRIEADEFRINGVLYAKNPRMTHLPGTHPPIQHTGWCKVIVGRRGRFWNFASPTFD